jgi:predicted ATPase/DNA-binding SARP family transcriptional activator
VVEFRVLGPIEAYSGDNRVHVGGVKQRSILALLIANRGHAVSTDRIVDEVYGEDAAPGARRSVQTIISMLRRDLADVIVGTGDGYRFDAPRDTVDVYRFEDTVAASLDHFGNNPSQTSMLLNSALGLWRGDPYGDVDGRSVFQTEIVRLTELRFTALEARIEADLACGRHREVLPELEALVAENPLRQHVWGLLMLALYRTGRQPDALGAYQQLSTVLGEQLGLEPSTDLRELEEQILLQDPALDLVAATPHNLPLSLTSFVGRRLELIELGELLAETRLVTVTGAGGSGKTRFAVEFGREVIGDYPDGVWFVDLRGVDADGVAPLVASTLGVITSGDTPIADQLVDALAGRRLLLALDNCEHVLDAVAPFVERLMSREGQVRILATSREPLGVPGEMMIPVRPLPLPESAGLEQVAVSDAVVLFTERAGSAQPGFALEEHVASVFEICRAVDGLPLALELAAARLVVFSPEELAVRLDDQLSILRSSQRAGDLRHATIETTITWSWELLADVERALLGRLSVFHGTWSLEAAEVICGFDPINRYQVLDLVASLVAKSLVVVDRVSRGSTRYRLLEPIRQYAARQTDDQATERLRGRSIDYWSATLAASYDTSGRVVLRNHEPAMSLEVDQTDVTAVVEWALNAGRFEDAMAILASPFGDLLLLQGSAAEPVTRWTDLALEHRESISPGTLLWALEVAGGIACSVSDNETWLGHATLGIENARSTEERHWFELNAAIATDRLGRHDEAAMMLDRVISQADDPGLRASALLARAEHEVPKQAWILTQRAMEVSPIGSLGWWTEESAAWAIGKAAADSGRYDVAAQMEERSAELSRRCGWRMQECHAIAVLSRVYAARGRLDEAAALIAGAMPEARRILGPNFTALVVLLRAADIARLGGDLSKARGYVEEARRSVERHDIQAQGMVAATYQAALIARDDQDQANARKLLDGLIRRFVVSGQASERVSLSQVHNARASVELRRADPKRALEDLGEVLAESRQLSHLDMVEAVDLVAIAFAQQGRAELAALLKGAIDHARDESCLAIYPPDESLRDEWMRHSQSILIDDWDTSVKRGRAMTLEDAVELATTEARSARDSRPRARHARG